jgi:glucokinase
LTCVGVYNVSVIKGTFVVQNPDGDLLIFDVGGSHVAASVFASPGLAVRPPESALVSATTSLSEFMEVIGLLAERALRGRIFPSGVSVAIPNPFDYSLGVSYMQHKYKYLYGIDLRREFSRLLNCPPNRINFLNDAAAFLMGEIQQGAGRDIHRVVGITLGTGVGSAFAIEGEILTKGPGVPSGGEIWNLPYRDGIVENYVSALAIQRIHEQNTGTSVSAEDIARSVVTRQEARRTYEQFGTELGRVLRTTCIAFGPERIILGGGISRAAAHFIPSATHELTGLPIQLEVSQLGERAALIGAAVNWMRKQNGMALPLEQNRTGAES